MRLHKFMADAGVASRRASEALIRAGRVQLNGQVVTRPGVCMRPGVDEVRVDGQVVGAPPAARTYIVLHKPAGVVSTAADPQGRPTVADLVRRTGGPSARLFPVGRLDLDSTGLMLLTNDGPLAHALTHPSREVPKTYRVRVQGQVGPETLATLRYGVQLEDGPARPDRVRLLDSGRTSSRLEITLHEGRHREVRRLLEAVGYPVLELTRVRLGPLELGRLAPGAWRHLTATEVRALRALRALRDAGAAPAEGFTAPASRDSMAANDRR